MAQRLLAEVPRLEPDRVLALPLGLDHITREQAHLETKILRLQARLRNAIVVEAPAAGATVVAFGGTVTVVDEESGREMTYTLVGPTEADLKSGKLSSESPVAQALLGHAEGDVADVQTPKGTKRWRVVKLA